MPLATVLSLALAPAEGLADVRFEHCVPVAGGGITCDTKPEGDTLFDEEDTRFGLFDEASPGWEEFDPYEGDDEMFGGHQT